MALGPGLPDPPTNSVVLRANYIWHRIGENFAVPGKSVLGGSHHECWLALKAGMIAISRSTAIQYHW